MSQLKLLVNNSLSVNILPNQEHEFLMTSKEVAEGYGITSSTLRDHIKAHSDELIVRKHFIKGVDISDTLAGTNLQPHQTFWTKRGIVRLGFFIKSDRAKQFRDWAEDLVIYVTESRERLLARIEQLETQLQALQQPALAAPSYNELQNNMVAFFDTWLRYGDLKRIAAQLQLNYVYVRAVRLNPARSQKVSQMLYELCLNNQRTAATQQRSLN